MAKNHEAGKAFLMVLIYLFFASIRHVFAVMTVKRISINWVAKLNDSKDLPKYGNSSDGKFSKKSG